MYHNSCISAGEKYSASWSDIHSHLCNYKRLQNCLRNMEDTGFSISKCQIKYYFIFLLASSYDFFSSCNFNSFWKSSLYFDDTLIAPWARLLLFTPSSRALVALLNKLLLIAYSRTYRSRFTYQDIDTVILFPVFLQDKRKLWLWQLLGW